MRQRPLIRTDVVSLGLDGLEPSIDDNGQLVFKDAAGVIRFMTPRAWMLDSAGDDETRGATSPEVSYDPTQRWPGWGVDEP